MASRSGKDSRCSKPDDAPYQWILHYDESHQSIKHLNEWLQSLKPFARSMIDGEIEATFELAAKGGLWKAGPRSKSRIEPVWKDPEMYEIRQKALSKPLRFYHGEPAKHPNVLVSLHKHIKVGDDDQQAQIEFAAGRYHWRVE